MKICKQKMLIHQLQKVHIVVLKKHFQQKNSITNYKIATWLTIHLQQSGDTNCNMTGLGLLQIATIEVRE